MRINPYRIIKMNTFIDECFAAGLRVEGGPIKMVDLDHNMDKIAGINNLAIHMFYHSCSPADWRMMVVISLNMKTCSHTDDEPEYRETAIEGPMQTGTPTREQLTEQSVKLVRLLLSLKFDRLNGTFKIAIPYYLPALSSAEDCCVCMEKTKTKTRCGHTLCAECWHQLDDDVCPMCRNDELRNCVCKKDVCDELP